MSVEIAVDTQEARWEVVRHKVYSDETLSSEEKAAAYKQLLKQDLTLVERLLKVPSQHLTGVLRNELSRTHEGGPSAGEARGDATATTTAGAAAGEDTRSLAEDMKSLGQKVEQLHEIVLLRKLGLHNPSAATQQTATHKASYDVSSYISRGLVPEKLRHRRAAVRPAVN